MFRKGYKWLGTAALILACSMLCGTVSPVKAAANSQINDMNDDIISDILVDGSALVPEAGKEPGKLGSLSDESKVRIISESWSKEDDLYKYELKLQANGGRAFWLKGDPTVETDGKTGIYGGYFLWENIIWGNYECRLDVGENGRYSVLTFLGSIKAPKPTYTYAVEEGNNSELTLGDGRTLRVKIDGDHTRLESVYLDADKLESKDYTVEKGSTIITVAAAALDRAGAGSHTLKAVFNDGGSREVTVGFTAKAPAAPAKPTTETGKPGSEAAKPTTETGKTGSEAAKPTTETGKPGSEAAKSATETGKTGSEAAKPTAGTGKTGSEAAKSSAETGKPAVETAKSSAETGKPAAKQESKTAAAASSAGTAQSQTGTAVKAPKTGDTGSASVWAFLAVSMICASVSALEMKKKR